MIKEVKSQPAKGKEEKDQNDPVYQNDKYISGKKPVLHH